MDPAWRPYCKADVSVLICFYLVFQGIKMRRVMGALERGDSTEWDGHQRTQPVNRSRTHYTSHEFAERILDILTVQSLSIPYQAHVLCLAVGQTLIQRWRQHKVVSLESEEFQRMEQVPEIRKCSDFPKENTKWNSQTSSFLVLRHSGFTSGWLTPLWSIWWATEVSFRLQNRGPFSLRFCSHSWSFCCYVLLASGP